MSGARSLRIVLALTAAAASSSCKTLDYEHLEKHVLATDVNGRIVDLRSGDALGPGKPIAALLDRLLQNAQEGATACAARAGPGARRELLIHIHGGMNAAQDSLSSAQAALDRMEADPQAPHPIFLTWPSGALSTYWDHLIAIRQGQRWPEAMGVASAPLVLVSDVASSVAAAPVTLLYQWLLDLRVAGKVAFDWNLDRATADEEALWKVAQDAGYHVSRGSYSRGWLSQFGRFVSYWLSQPPKIVFQILFLNGLGQGAWEVMLHRTRSMFHGPDEYALSSDQRGKPAELRAHVEDTKARLHAFFDRLALETCAADADGKPCWDITLVGHSMGAIVINEVLTTYPNLPIRNIVYMAPACSVRDAQKIVVPYLRRHLDARFFLLTLHPTAEADEKFSVLPWYDLVPRGSLLEWIDNWYTTPPSHADRTLGKWLNVIPAIHVFADVRERVFLKSFTVGGEPAPERHGDFNDFAFWKPSFWWDEGTTR